jgi:hypothetical protein
MGIGESFIYGLTALMGLFCVYLYIQLKKDL